MSRRIIENMIDEELTFIIVSKQMEDRDVITNLLFQYGYPLTFYRADLYKELNNDLFCLFDNPSYPAIFIRGKYIGNTQDLQYLLQADIELSSDGEMTIEE
jgi:serine kinase of HPr protein (carbohydrate metabolism regulator)